MPKVILTAGTFDLFHSGHINLFRRAKKMGDLLIVAVSTDKFNEEKGKRAFDSFEERCEVVKACRYVDLVLPEHSWESKELYTSLWNVDVFVMGDDWEGEFDGLPCEVKYLSRTPGVSSSEIRKKIEEERNESKS